MPLITRRAFGSTHKGEQVFCYTLTNVRGTQAEILTYGATVRALRLPTRNGGCDVVLGYDTLAGYEQADKYMGAVCGRFANRIGGGKFMLNGVRYQLACNNGPNHLHGGICGFDKKVWNAEVQGRTLCLRYQSPDGEEGYPGTLTVEACYSLSDADELSLTFKAWTDADTIVNLTNHTYWNLLGHGSGTVLEHELEVFAERFTENDQNCLPTGRLLQVENTPFDFRVPMRLGWRMEQPHVQLQNAGGYDHNFVLSGAADTLRCAARLYCPPAGRVLQVHTTQPGLQVYTGNFLDDKVPGKGGVCYAPHAGIALEAQGFPNAPVFTNFPSPVLHAGEVYCKKTVYTFR